MISRLFQIVFAAWTALIVISPIVVLLAALEHQSVPSEAWEWLGYYFAFPLIVFILLRRSDDDDGIPAVGSMIGVVA